MGPALDVDDALDFVTEAASNDANRQKKLLFGPGSSTLNNGRSKLEVDSTGGIVLRGKTDGTANTLVDRLDSGSTYYTFVDSGALTADFASFNNMDEEQQDSFTRPALLQPNSEVGWQVQLLDLYLLHLNITVRILLPFRVQSRA